MVSERMFKIWYHYDFIFYNTPTGWKFKKELKKFTDFINGVIVKKKALYYENKFNNDSLEAQTEECGKKIKSLLDLMIELTERNEAFSDQQLKDEVCTFLIAVSNLTELFLKFKLIYSILRVPIQVRSLLVIFY